MAGYKINIQKSVAFLHAHNELTDSEIKKTIPFRIASKGIKYLEINRTKDEKDLYSENSKTLKKETEEDTSKWKHIPCSWIGRTNIIKMSILPKALYRFSAIPVKIPVVYLTVLEQIFQKCIWNHKSPNSHSTLDKEDRVGRITLPDIKQYCEVIGIKRA